MLKISVINSYLIKNFLKKLFFTTLSLSLLIFVINLFDVLNKVKNADNVSIKEIIAMSSLQIPSFLSDIAMFLIMISAMLTLYNLSQKSEITIMRSAGMSVWKILQPLLITVFIIGILFIFLFLPLKIKSNDLYNKIESNLTTQSEEESFSPKNGIWLRQKNLENPEEEIKIRASKVYKKSLVMKNVTIWFFSKDNKFYKKIDAKYMILKDKKWLLKSIIINDQKLLNKELASLEIPTNLELDFILKKIINNFEDAKVFSIISLPRLIDDLESSGFSSRKFKVYFQYLLNQPLLFMAMVLAAAYFSINNVRNRNNIIFIIVGIMFGLITYIGSNIINALGASGILPAFMASWMITFLFFAVIILLLLKKETI